MSDGFDASPAARMRARRSFLRRFNQLVRGRAVLTLAGVPEVSPRPGLSRGMVAAEAPAGGGGGPQPELNLTEGPESLIGAYAEPLVLKQNDGNLTTGAFELRVSNQDVVPDRSWSAALTDQLRYFTGGSIASLFTMAGANWFAGTSSGGTLVVGIGTVVYATVLGLCWNIARLAQRRGPR
ncbi:hypothetical protein [Micromonospora sp. NPDC004704]